MKKVHGLTRMNLRGDEGGKELLEALLMALKLAASFCQLLKKHPKGIFIIKVIFQSARGVYKYGQ